MMNIVCEWVKWALWALLILKTTTNLVKTLLFHWNWIKSTTFVYRVTASHVILQIFSWCLPNSFPSKCISSLGIFNLQIITLDIEYINYISHFHPLKHTIVSPICIHIFVFNFHTTLCSFLLCEFPFSLERGEKQKTQKFACWELKRTRDLGNWKTHRAEHTEEKGQRWRAWKRERE